MSKRRTINGQFTMRPIEMLRSPAYRVLSLSARRVLDRIEIEHAKHGGKENGRLPVTHADFREYGIDRHAVAPGIREVVALGFVEQTQRGFAGTAQHQPSLFRLTYLPANPRGPTDEWKSVMTIEDANGIAASARAAKPKREWSFNRGAKTFPMGEKTKASGGNPHRKPMGETHNRGEKSRWGKPPHLSRCLAIYKGGADGGAAPERQPEPGARRPRGGGKGAA